MSILGDAVAGGLGALDVRAREDRKRKAELKDKMTFEQFVLEKKREIKLLEMQDAHQFQKDTLDERIDMASRLSAAETRQDVENEKYRFVALSPTRAARVAEDLRFKIEEMGQLGEEQRDQKRLDLINDIALELEFMDDKAGIAKDKATVKRQLMQLDAAGWTEFFGSVFNMGGEEARNWGVQIATGVANPALSGTRNVNVSGLAGATSPSLIVREQLGTLLGEHMEDERVASAAENAIVDAISAANATKLKDVLEQWIPSVPDSPARDYLYGLRALVRKFPDDKSLKKALDGTDPAIAMILGNDSNRLIGLYGPQAEEGGSGPPAPRMRGQRPTERPKEEVILEALNLMYVEPSE